MTRKSVSGSLTQLNQGLICWFSRKQKCISLSTFESEFYAVSEATKDIMWLRQLLEELDVSFSTPIKLLCDNTATIANITNRSYHNSTKHVDYRMKFTREKIIEGWLILSHVRTDDQLADFCTKPLPKEKHEKLVNRVMVQDAPVKEGCEEKSSQVTGASMFTRSFAMLTFLCLISLINSSPLLPRVSPVIWRPSTRDVINGSMILHFNIEARSPCTMFNKIGNNSAVRKVYYQTCEQTFNSQVESKLKKLYEQYQLIKSRHKRSWISVATVAAPVAVTALLSAPVSVAVATVVSLGIAAFTVYSEFKSQISDVETGLDEHQKVLRAVNDDLKSLRDNLADDEKQMDSKFAELAEGSSLESQLIAKFSSISHDLDESILSARRGKLMDGLIHAFDLRAPCKDRCPQHLWEPFNFTRFLITHEKEKHIIYQYSVRAMLVDTACKVLDAQPFTLLTRNDTHTCEQMYSGERYIMFNHSSVGCPVFTFNQVEGDLYYRVKPRCDDREETWETVKCRLNTAIQPDRVQVRPYLSDVYVYCYPDSIFIFGERITCPNYVFKLPLSAKFTINDFTYQGSEQQIISTMFKDRMMMEIINLHVKQPSDSHWFKLKTEKEIEHLHTRAYTHAFYPLATVISFFILGCCARRFYVCCALHRNPVSSAPPPPPYEQNGSIEMSHLNHGFIREQSSVELGESSPLKNQSSGQQSVRRSERTRIRRML